MSFATGLQSTALQLLTTYGEVLSFSRETEGVYNTSTSSTATDIITTFTGFGHPSPYKISEVNGTDILVTDVMLLTHTSTRPSIGDVVTVGGIVYRVMNVTPLRAQATDIIYKLQLRV